MTGARVLIVDDEPKMQRILELMLKQMGHKAVLAGNGREAHRQLLAEEVDLVISDLQMPEMTGLELLETLRGEGNAVPFIIVTAFGSVETAVAAMKQGACDYIIRPFEVEAVELAITRALALRQIQRENRFLREQVSEGWGEFIGRSAPMLSIYEMIQQVAPGKTNVLILGETGTGKELVARAIHQASPRRQGLFVPINCAAIPADILESEMFGHVRGAFTGAHREREGKFEMADGGTLFLDEITEMPQQLQAKLLRVLQEEIVERLGSNERIKIDIRLIAATNRDPGQAIRDQRLREDLYYRIQVFTLQLPPLRERADDVPLLVEHFLRKLGGKLGIAPGGITPLAVERLCQYAWPGNVRELENVIERAVVLSRGAMIDVGYLPHEMLAPSSGCGPSETENAAVDDSAVLRDFELEPAIEKLERRYLTQALSNSGGNKTKAARLLEISERSLWYKLKKYGLS